VAQIIFIFSSDQNLKMQMQPQIIILKEGTDTSQGKGQLLSNINATQSIADSIRTTLGPRGMDKLIVDSKSNIKLIRSNHHQ
jgi:T-complex protein 1 subunit eta